MGSASEGEMRKKYTDEAGCAVIRDIDTPQL